MNIIILGAGKVGYNLARQLIHENKKVLIIEKDPLKVKRVSSQLDCMVINSEGNNLEILRQAGIEKADYFISVTESDELNMIACGLASSVSNFDTCFLAFSDRFVIFSVRSILSLPQNFLMLKYFHL